MEPRPEGTRMEVNGARWSALVYGGACERLYAELAWSYDAVSWLVSAGRWSRWRAGVWAWVEEEPVLELGVGTGVLLAEGLGQGRKMTGVDASERMLTQAAARGGRGVVVQADGRALPLAGEVYGSVVATFPAGYVLEAATLAECRRVLKPGGRLALHGLWVDAPGSRWWPVFFGRPSARAQATMAGRLAAAGFVPRWEMQRDDPFTVGALVGERL